MIVPYPDKVILEHSLSIRLPLIELLYTVLFVHHTILLRQKTEYTTSSINALDEDGLIVLSP